MLCFIIDEEIKSDLFISNLVARSVKKSIVYSCQADNQAGADTVETYVTVRHPSNSHNIEYRGFDSCYNSYT